MCEKRIEYGLVAAPCPANVGILNALAHSGEHGNEGNFHQEILSLHPHNELCSTESANRIKVASQKQIKLAVPVANRNTLSRLQCSGTLS
jgi:hypothetical protein